MERTTRAEAADDENAVVSDLAEAAHKDGAIFTRCQLDLAGSTYKGMSSTELDLKGKAHDWAHGEGKLTLKDVRVKPRIASTNSFF